MPPSLLTRPLPVPPVLLSLPEDVLGLISHSLRPSDLCSLMLTCRDLRSSLSSSDKVWLPQCLRLSSSCSFLTTSLLHHWRDRLPSYRAICRFLSAVVPLLGVWVHQNPELGNVVCVLPGFLSVVGCRVIPQEIGSVGIYESSLLYTPVFEILAAGDGSVSGFYLHGRDSSEDSIFPGSVKSIVTRPNVLFLEVDEPNFSSSSTQRQTQFYQEKNSSFSYRTAATSTTTTTARKLRRSDTTAPRPPSPTPPPAPFSRLAFKDRRKLLEHVALGVGFKVPSDIIDAPLFPNLGSGSDTESLVQRWEALTRLQKNVRGCLDKKDAKLALDGGGFGSRSSSSSSSGRRRSLGASIGGYMKQVLGKGSSVDWRSNADSNKHVQLHEFLRPMEAIGLSLRAINAKLATYRAWPQMPDNRFALYKLPVQVPAEGKELAGLWGGTFGWPPGQTSEDKPGKALFFLLLSYEEVDGRLLLIATKILEGTHYVLHPNGSAMFVAKVDEPSTEPFPWAAVDASTSVEVKQSYGGEGIANGYGFRYPGSKPGSLYIIQDGLLAFVWTESKAVLTLQRLDLQELLRKGERVPAPPPIANFVYLTKSYSNVFAGFANSSNSSQAPRFLS